MKGLLIQEETPTPDSPSEIKWCMVDENADKYITKLEQKIERLNNIINPKKNNYDYIKLLFEKSEKEELIKAFTYKCEQLEKLSKSYMKLEVEIYDKDNIINELEKFFKYAYDNEVKPFNDRKISVWTICLDKLKELKEDNK